jgi:type IV pilus assembly protein PilM
LRNFLGRLGGGQGIGLDVDRGAIKAVQVSRSGNSYSLRHVGYRRLAYGAVVDGEVADHDLLASELREFWEAHGFKGKSVLLGLSNQKVVVRLLEMPRMSDDDLKGAIQFEAQDRIPLPLDEAVMDYVSLGPGPEGSDLDRILIVAAESEMIRRYTSAARAAGLNPKGVDVKALSLARSTLPLFADEEGAVLLLDVGYELSNLVVAQERNPMLARFLPGGSAHISRTASDYARIPEDEAEEHLTNPAVHIGDESSRKPEGESWGRDDAEIDPAVLYDVRRGIEDAVQLLAEDVQRSIEYHYSQPGSREVVRVVVSGEGAMISGFDGYLGELLGLPVSRGRPLARIAANQSNVSDEQLEMMEPVLAVALGLAVEDA